MNDADRGQQAAARQLSIGQAYACQGEQLGVSFGAASSTAREQDLPECERLGAFRANTRHLNTRPLA